MAGIIFFYEESYKDVFSGANEETMNAWNYARHIGGGIDCMVVINCTGEHLESPDQSLDFLEIPCNRLDQAAEILNSINGSNKAFFVTPWEAPHFGTPQDLWSWDHETDWYVFGPASGWSAISSHPVGTPITIPQHGMGAAHAIHVATAVMFHRAGVKP